MLSLPSPLAQGERTEVRGFQNAATGTVRTLTLPSPFGEGEAVSREDIVSPPHREQRSVAGKSAHVLRTFECAGVRTILLTHDAFNFGQ